MRREGRRKFDEVIEVLGWSLIKDSYRLNRSEEAKEGRKRDEEDEWGSKARRSEG